MSPGETTTKTVKKENPFYEFYRSFIHTIKSPMNLNSFSLLPFSLLRLNTLSWWNTNTRLCIQVEQTNGKFTRRNSSTKIVYEKASKVEEEEELAMIFFLLRCHHTSHHSIVELLSNGKRVDWCDCINIIIFAYLLGIFMLNSFTVTVKVHEEETSLQGTRKKEVKFSVR